MMVCAHAQEMGKTRKHQSTQKTEDTAKTKADEQAYKDALKRIPNSTKKVDPWQDVR
jgi:prophage maintenance system killer protein